MLSSFLQVVLNFVKIQPCQQSSANLPSIAGTRITLYDVMDSLKAQYLRKFSRDRLTLTQKSLFYLESG